MALQGLLALALLLWPSRAAGARPVLGPTAFVGQPTAYLDWRASN
jgi:predicted anti-sigma-YlaC factor YlaD